MSRYRQTMTEALKKVYEQESDHEISMARGELEAIADKATQLASSLQGKSDEGNPLEAWVQSKITKAKDYINSVSDYLMYNPDMAKEETILEKSFTSQQIKQAYGILNDPRYKGGNYDGAVKAIEKLAKGLSNHPDVKNALKRANEEVDLDEGKIKDIFTANQEGESIDDIAKRLKMSVKDVRKILGEEVLDEKVADSIVRDLQKAYAPLKGKTISPEMANKMSKHLDGQSYDVVTLRQLMKADIPFISTLARNKIYKKTGKFESVEEQQQVPVQKEPQDNQQALNAKDKEIESLKGQITVLRQKVENEKNRSVKPVPNPETGEVPLTIGLAHKLLKDKEEEEQKEKKEKENSEKIKQLSKETKLESFTRKFLQHLNESEASDKAKSMGLDYMKFGRYGKDGKVTHKSVGGTLTALSKKDQEKEKDVTKTPKAEPKKSEPVSDDEVDIKIKSRNFLKDLEDNNLEDEEGFPIEVIFDQGESGIDGIQNAIDKASEMGLEDLANDLDDVAYHITEYEPNEAQAKYQDLMAKYSGKPVKAVEYADKVDKAVMMMSDQTYTNDPAPFANDLMSTMSIVKKMVDSDKTEGSSGSGMSNGSKGFRPEVIDTLQSLSDISDYAAELEKEYKGKDEKVREILGDLQGEINFITDEDSDHDNYTKSYKVNSVVDTIIDMAKELQKRLKVKNESVDNYPTSDIAKHKKDVATDPKMGEKKPVHLGAKMTYESIAAVKKKAEKTGMPYSVLKKVYDRGMAAWRGGHRPGATQQQWALARVNSFVTKSSGTWGGADKDLAKQVRGSKK